MAVGAFFDAETKWFVEFDEAPSKVLAHHWPGVPNLGDVTKVDWSQVEPVDIITGGSPCQDLSQAGKRAGMTAGTRSNLWVNMREAIETIRPQLVVWENVRGALSAKAISESDMESDSGQMGNLKALGRVLGDLAEIGYDARWATIRASDVGAPHQRARVFLVAYPANAAGIGLEARQLPGGSEAEESCDNGSVRTLPTPNAYSGSAGGGQHPDKRRAGGHSVGINDAAIAMGPGAETESPYGRYEEAVSRWGKLFRPAPYPTETGARGKHRLNIEFAEWMMGLPAGHVTSPEIGLSRASQIKAIGNGVCPQQAFAAIEILTSDEELV